MVYNSLTRSKSKNNNNNICKSLDGADGPSRCARVDSNPAGWVENQYVNYSILKPHMRSRARGYPSTYFSVPSSRGSRPTSLPVDPLPPPAAAAAQASWSSSTESPSSPFYVNESVFGSARPPRPPDRTFSLPPENDCGPKSPTFSQPGTKLGNLTIILHVLPIYFLTMACTATAPDQYM